MLAGELKKFDLKVAAGEAQPPPQVPSAAPPSLSGLHISGPVSQSLPAAGAHLSGGGFLPPKPRVRPAAPTLSQLPILELPEASPHSCSLLDDSPLRAMAGASQSVQEEADDDEESSFIGGTCVPPQSLEISPSHPILRAREAPARSPTAELPCLLTTFDSTLV